MNVTPKAIALTASAALGTIGSFLPFLGGMSLATIAAGSHTPLRGMFVIPLVILLALGVVAVITKRAARWQGIVGALFSAFVFVMLDGAGFHGKFKATGFATIFSQGDIGAKLVVLGAIGALITTLIVAFKPDPKVA